MIRNKIIFGIICCLFVLYLTGCSSDKSIVGTWEPQNSSKGNMKFYDDGTCINVPVTVSPYSVYTTYKMQDDGILIFTSPDHSTKTKEPTDDERIAMEDSEYYYLSGDKLIFHCKVYLRE